MDKVGGYSNGEDSPIISLLRIIFSIIFVLFVVMIVLILFGMAYRPLGDFLAYLFEPFLPDILDMIEELRNLLSANHIDMTENI